MRQEFLVLRNNGEAEPVPHAVHNRFAAVERELELVPAIIEHDRLARGIDVTQELIEFRDVVDAQVIAWPNLDDLPVHAG